MDRRSRRGSKIYLLWHRRFVPFEIVSPPQVSQSRSGICRLNVLNVGHRDRAFKGKETASARVDYIGGKSGRITSQADESHPAQGGRRFHVFERPWIAGRNAFAESNDVTGLISQHDPAVPTS